MVRHLCTICGVDRRNTDPNEKWIGHKMSCPVSKHGVTPMWRLVIVKDNR